MGGSGMSHGSKVSRDVQYAKVGGLLKENKRLKVDLTGLKA